MASVNSVNSNTLSSIYGNRNIITGLASGMDTESMIENAVSGIKMKISSLQQKRTKVEWQQQSLRSIIDKMANFTQKYTSYASSTNLMSASFFNNAMKVTANGEFADKIAASGRTSSDVRILGVKQLATAATYRLNGLGGSGSDVPAITAAKEVQLNGPLKTSLVDGSLTLKYNGNSTLSLDFDSMDVFEDAEALAANIKEQLAGQKVKVGQESVDASSVIDVKVDNGNIVFENIESKGEKGAKVEITGASGNIKDTLGIDTSGDTKPSSLKIGETQLYSEGKTLGDSLAGKELSITLDGKTKTITLPEYTKEDGKLTTRKDYVANLQKQLNDAFGEGKVTVKNLADPKSNKLQLSFEAGKGSGSTLRLSGDAAKALGFSSNNETSYLNMGKTLGDVADQAGLDFSKYDMVKATGKVREVKASDGSVSYVDEKGNKVAKSDKSGDDTYYRVDDKGEFLRDFQLNGKSIGAFSKNTALESVLTAINNSDAGVKVSFSQTTNQFQFTATETGEAGRIEFGKGLAQDLFGGGEGKEGQDAILSMSVNGQQYTDIQRGGNSFEVDGLTINLKGTFNYEDDTVNDDGEVTARGGLKAGAADNAVSFTSSSDADKIVDTIKSWVNDYNEMISEIKNAYSTMPATKTDGSRYEPLTADQESGLTETEIKNYEEKAKQGVLFADRDLSNLYSKLTSALGGENGAALRKLGIDTAYSNGLTTLTLDENKLRSALESNPDSVKEAFSRTIDSGASRDGIMKTLKDQMDRYASTVGTKGILVNRAGSVKAPATINSNSMQNQLNNFDKQIERWESKMSDQVDRYTQQFSKLEQLIAQMNSQSSALMGLMGGSGSY